MQQAFRRLTFLALACALNCDATSAKEHGNQHRRSLRAAPRRQQLSMTQNQERKVEALEAAEREALTAQQVALEALTAQQGALAAQQQVLQAEQKQLEDHLTMIHSQQPPSSAGSLGKEQIVEKVIGAAVYVGLVCLTGFIYNLLHMSELPQPKKARNEDRTGFTYGLFEGLNCADVDWKICFCACFCGSVRWADTVSDFKVHFLDFWPALLIFALLQVAGSFTFGLSGLMLLLLTVQTRQRIRHAYELPYGTCDTTANDCCVWAFCAPCAIMQEAMQIEFVEPPLPESMHGAPYHQMK